MNYNKEDIFKETVKILQMNLDNIKKSAKNTKERAIAAPGAAVSHSDTTKNQLQTLAGGLDQRVYTLETELGNLMNYKIKKNLHTVSLGALVGLENLDTGIEKYCYILPAGAGTKIQTSKGPVNIITINAPLFVAMHGKNEGDEFTFNHNGSSQEYYVGKIQ